MDHDENLPPSRQREILQQRKIAKPLMEKRRRERINNCLEQLKSLLTEVTKKLDDDEEENSYRSKLEKADILEMTVNYLKSVKRQKMTTEAISSSTSSADPASSSSTSSSISSSTSSSTSSSVHSRYVAGFRECAQQVAKYLEKADGLSATTRSTIIQHLTRRLHHQHQHHQQQHHQQHQQHHQHQHHHQHQQQSISTSTIHQKHSNYLSGTTSSTASSSSSSSPRLMMISSPASTAPPPPPPPLPPAAVGFVVQTPPSFSSVSESVHSSSASVIPSHHPIQLLPVQLATGETVFVLANANDLIPLRQQIHILTEQTTTVGGTKQTNEAMMQQPMDTADNNGILIYEAISPAEAVVSPLQISQQNNHMDHPNPPLSYPCSTSSSTSSSADVYGKLQMMNYPPHPHPPLVKSDQSVTQWNLLFSNTAAASEFDPLESKCPPPAGHCRALLSADCFSSSSVVDGRPILLPLPQIDTNAMTFSDTCHQMSDDPCQVWRPW